MPDNDSPLVALDSQPAKDSPSVAEARHIVRERMLLAAIDELFEIGMNRENKASDRNTALKEIVAFAEGAEGTEGRLLARLSPGAARRLAKLGKELEDERQGIAKRQLKAGTTESDGGVLPDDP